MNEIIQKALEALENANISGYFEEMDKVVMPPEQRTRLNELRNMFTSDRYGHDFHQKLRAFAQGVNQSEGENIHTPDKKALKELFAEDEKAFFEKMESLLFGEALDSLLQKKNKLKKIKKEFKDEFITREQYNTDFAKIERYLFELIDNIK